MNNREGAIGSIWTQFSGHDLRPGIDAGLRAVGGGTVGQPSVHLEERRAPLPETVARLRGRDYLGANVTVPHKERVVPLLDRLTEAVGGH